MAEQEKAPGHCAYQRLEVLERIVAGAPHVGGGKETEDILG